MKLILSETCNSIQVINDNIDLNSGILSDFTLIPEFNCTPLTPIDVLSCVNPEALLDQLACESNDQFISISYGVVSNLNPDYITNVSFTSSNPAVSVILNPETVFRFDINVPTSQIGNAVIIEGQYVFQSGVILNTTLSLLPSGTSCDDLIIQVSEVNISENCIYGNETLSPPELGVSVLSCENQTIVLNIENIENIVNSSWTSITGVVITADGTQGTVDFSGISNTVIPIVFVFELESGYIGYFNFDIIYLGTNDCSNFQSIANQAVVNIAGNSPIDGTIGVNYTQALKAVPNGQASIIQEIPILEDGVYRFCLNASFEDGSFIEECGCMFVDCQIKCTIAELLNNCDLKEASQIESLYRGIKYMENCEDCQCTSMCEMYEQLLDLIENTNCDENTSECPNC